MFLQNKQTHLTTRTRQCGFTLIELAVVLTIAMVMAALVFSSYLASLERTKHDIAERDGEQLMYALERHFYDNSDAGTSAKAIFRNFCRAMPFTQSPKQGTADYTFNCIGDEFAPTPGDLSFVAIRVGNPFCFIQFKRNGHVSTTEDCNI